LRFTVDSVEAFGFEVLVFGSGRSPTAATCEKNPWQSSTPTTMTPTKRWTDSRPPD